MPLTFAHPAIILPLNSLSKRYISLTGLIVGSVVPDFEYFIRMKVYSIYSHTWFGLLWFDLPLAIALTFVYHGLVRDRLIANLPSALYKRLTPYTQFNWNQYFAKYFFVVIISVLIGAASHLFWDSFTHINGYFVSAWGMSREASILGLHLPLYKFIQHISTLLGGMVVIIALLKLPVLLCNRSKVVFHYWFGISTVVVVILVLRVMLGLAVTQYPNLIVTALSGFITGIILMPVVYRVSTKKEFDRLGKLPK